MSIFVTKLLQTSIYEDSISLYILQHMSIMLINSSSGIIAHCYALCNFETVLCFHAKIGGYTSLLLELLKMRETTPDF